MELMTGRPPNRTWASHLTGNCVNIETHSVIHLDRYGFLGSGIRLFAEVNRLKHSYKIHVYSKFAKKQDLMYMF